MYWEKYCNSIYFPGVEILLKGTVSKSFWKICPKRCGNCAFSKSLYTRKLGEIKIFFAVIIVVNKNFIDQKVAQNHYFYITTLFIAMAAFGRGYDLYSILFFFTVVF